MRSNKSIQHDHFMLQMDSGILEIQRKSVKPIQLTSKNTWKVVSPIRASGNKKKQSPILNYLQPIKNLNLTSNG